MTDATLQQEKEQQRKTFDFLGTKESIRLKKRRLFYCFALNMLGAVLVFYLLIAFFFLDGMSLIEEFGSYSLKTDLWHPKAFFITFGVLNFIILSVSWSKVNEMKQGGAVVAVELGGRPLLPFTQDTNERKLRNVVEEIALAAGVGVPDIYILDGNMSINAFAAGYMQEDSVIGVTQGALVYLSRDELQGVVAHEFSHILNQDVRIRTYLAGMSFGFMFLVKIFGAPFKIFQNATDQRTALLVRRNMPGGVLMIYIVILLLSLSLLIVGSISYFFGLLLQMAVARQMERMADGTAVEYTRYPQGLASALKKIGAYASRRPFGMALQMWGREFAPFFFANSGLFFMERFFSSHPPLMERIKALEPSFDGNYSGIKIKQVEETPETLRKSTERDVRRITIEQSPLRERRNWGLSGMDSQEAQYLLQDIPLNVLSKLREPLMTVAVILALHLDKCEAIREKQREIIRKAFPDELLEQSELLSYEFMELSLTQKFTIGSLSLPSLRQMSREQFLDFDKILQQMVESDGIVDLFEYCLLGRIRQVLSRYFSAEVKSLKNRKPTDFPEECRAILSVLARMGGGSEAEMQAAFELGTELLGFPENRLLPLSQEECGAVKLEQVFGRLRLLKREFKGSFLLACRWVSDFIGRRSASRGEDFLTLLGYALEADRELMAEYLWES